MQVRRSWAGQLAAPLFLICLGCFCLVCLILTVILLAVPRRVCGGRLVRVAAAAALALPLATGLIRLGLGRKIVDRIEPRLTFNKHHAAYVKRTDPIARQMCGSASCSSLPQLGTLVSEQERSRLVDSIFNKSELWTVDARWYGAPQLYLGPKFKHHFWRGGDWTYKGYLNAVNDTMMQDFGWLYHRIVAALESALQARVELHNNTALPFAVQLPNVLFEVIPGSIHSDLVSPLASPYDPLLQSDLCNRSRQYAILLPLAKPSSGMSLNWFSYSAECADELGAARVDCVVHHVHDYTPGQAIYFPSAIMHRIGSHPQVTSCIAGGGAPPVAKAAAATADARIMFVAFAVPCRANATSDEIIYQLAPF